MAASGEEKELHVPLPDGFRVDPGASRPKQNGALIYTMVLPPDLKSRVDDLARERGCLPDDVLLAFAIQGERCERLGHDGRLKP